MYISTVNSHLEAHPVKTILKSIGIESLPHKKNRKPHNIKLHKNAMKNTQTVVKSKNKNYFLGAF
jgi:hypothetical protein